MPAATQANQHAQLATAFGADKLLLERFTALERLSKPFEIVIEALSEDSLDFESKLGTGVGITVTGDDLVKRGFHGVLFEAESMGTAETYYRYRLVLRPALSLLTFGQTMRIFQKKSVKDIIKQVLSEHGIADFTINSGDAGSDVREYCVQFRESDFHFLSRLMEEEGIYYFFEHTDNSHTIKFCDGPGSHSAFSGGQVAVFRGDSGSTQDEHLSRWDSQVRPGIIKATLRDSHFRRPDTPTAQTSSAAGVGPAETAEFYDYPAGYGYIADDGASGLGKTRYAETRLAEHRADRKLYFGGGNVFAVPVGVRLDVKDGDDVVQTMVVAATHAFGPQRYLSTDTDGAVSIVVEIEAIPVDVVWRPARVTVKPLSGGPQTAVVVGSVQEGPDVDEYGRIHVQFEWDREGQHDRNSSCWVRVSQGWADDQFGHMNIPRVGEEVLVDFLDGDPDRPIVTGRVYNFKKMPPYVLPDNKTISTWKSKTVGASGDYSGSENPSVPSPGFNELKFEDKGGSEEVFIHAQRDFNTVVELDSKQKINRDVSTRIGRNREVSIKQNETLTLDEGDESRTLTKGSRKTTIEKADTLTLNTGDYSMSVVQGQVTIEAMQKITLKVGQNSIEISQQGIKVAGLTVDVKATTAWSASGLTTELKASTMMTISGALVNIN